jgi:hypothetical protein
MVGLPDTSVRESRDRVRSAIRNSGFEFPPHRITVNLAPADVRKAGSSFDLPIALGILAASGIVERRLIADTVLLGELSLDGSIHATRATADRRQRQRDGLRGVFFRPPTRARRRSSRVSRSLPSRLWLKPFGRWRPAGFTPNIPVMPGATERPIAHHARAAQVRRLRRI